MKPVGCALQIIIKQSRNRMKNAHTQYSLMSMDNTGLRNPAANAAVHIVSVLMEKERNER